MNVEENEYEQIVALHHEALYRFAYSLVGNQDDAAELTQETYVRLLNKSWQLRDRARLKSWLFTTLYRIFLGWRRREKRFPHFEVVSVEAELPVCTPDLADELDGGAVMEQVLELEEHFRVPLVLYYLQCLSYREIAKVLNVPIGTVMSRLSRGKDLLRQRLSASLRRQSGQANKAKEQEEPLPTTVCSYEPK
jgi:RNA polymerase sigma-70 factor, ECF subfamily